MATPHPIHPHPHDEAACKRRLAELQGLSLWDKIKIYRALKKLITNNAMLEKLKSRKFLITVAVAAFTAAAGYLGLDPEIVAMILKWTVGTYLVSQGAVDAVKEFKAEPATKTSKAH